MAIKDFLQEPDIQQLLEAEDLDEIYKKFNYKNLYLTNFFLENNINPLDYMTSIPVDMYSHLKIENIIVPNNIKYIASDAFSNCPNLKSVTISDSVASIGDDAFKWCVSLKDINIPNGLTYIGKEAFFGCTTLESISIPDTLTYISAGAFCNCYELKSITIGNNVTRIGYSAFFRCTSLTSIKYIGTKDEWRKINKGANWRLESQIQEINCTDGIIKLR